MGRQACLCSQLYAALAQAFCKPEAASGEGESLARTLRHAAAAVSTETLGRLANETVGSLEICGDQAEQGLRALEIAYNRLFVGPGRPQAPPYESFYRDKWGLVMGPSAREVERRYAEAGLAMAPDHRDLPDHVVTELGFMAYLTMREAAAKGEERRTWQRRERLFLQDHLGAWLPPFCRQVQEAGQHPFYTALAELAVTFVDLDTQRLEDRQMDGLENDQPPYVPVSESTESDVRGQSDK
jgi:DMSO reductase family type II enzyme chaperone